MRFKELLAESYECVKIGGILRNLTNDEMRIYKKVKAYGKVFKQELSEYDANVATTMVSKGILRRKKAQQDEGHGRIYYIAKGRKGHLKGGELDEVAPPGKESEKWIKKNKKRFKEKYGKDYEKYLYGKAWNNYNGKKKLKESVDMNNFSEADIKTMRDFVAAFERLAVACNGNREPSADTFYKMYRVANDFRNMSSSGRNVFPEFNTLTSDLEDEVERIVDRIRDNTADNCDTSDYAVYDRGDYDSEGTIENIENEYRNGVYDIMDEFIPNIKVRGAMSDFIDSLKQARDDYTNSNSEPEFNGDFDSVETTDDSEKSEDYKETINQINGFIDKCVNAYESDRNIIETVIAVKNDNDDESKDLYDEICDALHDFEGVGWDYVHDVLSEEDYGFISRGEDEYNSEATWDRIYEASLEDLYNSYGDSDDASALLKSCRDIYIAIKHLFNEPVEDEEDNDTIQQQPVSPAEADEAGSEYNE